MKCVACKRKDVLYPVIDRYSNRDACPYCRALDSIVPGDGETAETLKERRAFAEAQGWRFLMETSFEVLEQPLSASLDGAQIVLYTESEGGVWIPLLVPSEGLEPMLAQYRTKGTISLPTYEDPRRAAREVTVISLMVATPAVYLTKRPIIRQVNEHEASR